MPPARLRQGQPREGFHPNIQIEQLEPLFPLAEPAPLNFSQTLGAPSPLSYYGPGSGGVPFSQVKVIGSK